jgi:hypothetical protein
MCYFPGHSIFQTRCTIIDGQLLYNFVNKKLSILHYRSTRYTGIVQIWDYPTYSTIQQTTAPWWAVCRYGGMVLANQFIPPPGASSERAVRGCLKRILLKLIIRRRNKFICKLAYFILVFYTPHSILAKTMDLCPSHAPRWLRQLYLPPYTNADIFLLVVVSKIINWRPSKAKVYYNCIFFSSFKSLPKLKR